MGRKHDGVRPLGRGAGWIRSVGRTRLGSGLFEGTTGALIQSLLVLAVLWTFCWWPWKRKMFIRI